MSSTPTPTQLGTPSHRISIFEGMIWAGFAAIALAIVFLVPRAMPVAPTVSDSYLFGYNNRAGVAILLAALSIAGYFSSRLGIRFKQPKQMERISSIAIAKWMAIYGVLCGVMYWLTRGFLGMGESDYFIERTAMAARGLRPYRDFEFGYGAGLVYGPRALMFFGLTAEQATFVFLGFCYLLSVWLLAQVLDRIDYPTYLKARIFNLFALFGTIPVFIGTGLNYTYLRFLLGPFFALLVHKVVSRNNQRDRFAAMCLVVGFTVILLLVSPEQGLAFALGTLAYFAACWWIDRSLTKWPGILIYSSLFVSQAVIFLVAVRLDLFQSLKSMGSGAFNFPIIPAGHILLFFFCCVIVTFYIATRLRERSKGESVLIVAAVSIPLLPAALGRCDPWHVIFNGTGIVLAATVLVSTMPRIWRLYQPLLVIFFILLPAVGYTQSYRPLLRRAFYLRVLLSPPPFFKAQASARAVQHLQLNPGNSEITAQLAVLKATSGSRALDLHSAYPGFDGIFEAPFDYNPNGFGMYEGADVDPGYYSALEFAITRESIDRKIDELKSHPERNLLLPDHVSWHCNQDPAVQQHTINSIFSYPFRETPRNLTNLWRPLCAYILSNYHIVQKPSQQGYDWTVWAPGTQS